MYSPLLRYVHFEQNPKRGDHCKIYYPYNKEAAKIKPAIEQNFTPFSLALIDQLKSF